MAVEQTQSFASYLKQLLLPISLFLYVTSIVLQLKESLEQLGLQIFCVGLFAFVALWVAYVWTTRVTSTIDPNDNYFRFNKKVRYGAIVSLLLTTIPFGYIVKIYKLPVVHFQVHNKSDFKITVKHLNNYMIRKVGTNGFDYPLENGLIKVYRNESNDKDLQIEKNSKAFFIGKFLNKNQIRHFLSTGDVFISLRIKLEEGGIADSDKMLLLTRDALNNNYLYLTFGN